MRCVCAVDATSSRKRARSRRWSPASSFSPRAPTRSSRPGRVPKLSRPGGDSSRLLRFVIAGYSRWTRICCTTRDRASSRECAPCAAGSGSPGAEPMRVAVVRQRYSPQGGAERFIERALAALAGRGVAVTVLAREWTGDPGNVVRCDPFYVGRVWRDWSFALAVCREVTRQSFDVVQSHERIACCDIYRAGDGVHAQWLHNRAAALGALARVGLALNPYRRYVLAAERRLFASPRLRAVICNSL